MWELDYKESWTLKNWCLWTVVLEKTLESSLTARISHQSILKEISPIHWKNWCWSWNSNTLPTWCKELTHWKRPWCWERLKAGRGGDNRGGDGWMASPTRWTWVWVSDEQGSLLCCSLWGGKESHTTERLNWMNWTDMLSFSDTGINSTCWKKK